MKIAVIMENMPHVVSGGRYYTWLMACVLGELGHDVTLYTNVVSSFYKEAFKYYKQPKIKQAILKTLDIDGFDVYLGAPFGGCYVAHRLAKEHGAWCVNIMLDPKPLVMKYIPEKGRAIYQKVPEDKLQKAMQDCTIISNSWHAIPTLREWFDNGDVAAVTATVNERAARAVGKPGRKKTVSTVSRWEAHKGFLDAVHAVRHLPGPPEFHIVTSFPGDGDRMQRECARHGIRAVVHRNASEEQKFKVLAESRMFIFASHYEGQGIPVLEAQLVGTPGVAYDFPVMREMAGGWPLAKYRDRKDLAEKAKKVWDNPKPPKVKHNLDFMKKELEAVF